MSTSSQAGYVDGVHGKLWVEMVSAPSASHRGGPLLLVLPGAARSVVNVKPWATLAASFFDVAVADLPGHGRSSVPERVSLSGFVDEVRHLIAVVFVTRRVVLVGESLGGLVSLVLGGDPPPNLAAVVAADPPLSTAKLWPVIADLRAVLVAYPSNGFLSDLAREFFGVMAESNVVENKDYASHLKHVALPALIITGDVPLGAPRTTTVFPCLLDEEDRALLRNVHGDRIALQILDGAGHELLSKNTEASFAVARSFVERLPAR